MYPSKKEYVTEEDMVIEAKSHVKALVEFLRFEHGLSKAISIYTLAIKASVPESSIKSLWSRERKEVSGAVLENLRTYYEATHNAIRQRELEQRDRSRSLVEKLDPDIAKPLLKAIAWSDRINPPKG